MIRSLLLVALLACTAWPAAAQDALKARFDARYRRIPHGFDGDPDGRPYPRLWSTLDSLVVRELDRGRGADEVNALLATLQGFAAPTEGKSVVIGRGRFVSQMPREVPSYFVAPLRVHGRPVMLGVYQADPNTPGRLTAYTRESGRWAATGRLDTRWPADAYLLPLADSGMVVVTVEQFIGADHLDGRVRMWDISGGRFVLRDSLAGEMKEPQVRSARDTVQLFFTRFPTRLGFAILGVRIEHYVTLAVEGTRIRRTSVIGNPWVEVLDRYYDLAARHRTREAAALLANPALARSLGIRPPSAFDERGDLDAGHGEVIITRAQGAYRVESRLGADGAWRITRVVSIPDPRDTL